MDNNKYKIELVHDSEINGATRWKLISANGATHDNMVNATALNV